MKEQRGFTLIELLAVIVVLAIIALIVTPIVSDIITSSKKAANARSVEGHVKDVQIAIMSKMFETENGDLSIYDTDTVLDSSLEISNDTRVTCASYVVRSGIVKTATGCRVDNSTETYEYAENEGARETGTTPATPSTPAQNLPECDGCVYATSIVSGTNVGSKTRPTNRNAYLKFVLVNNEVPANQQPDVCGYSEGTGEFCLDVLTSLVAENTMKQHFDFANMTGVTTEDPTISRYEKTGSNNETIYCQYSDEDRVFECGNGSIVARVIKDDGAIVFDGNTFKCEAYDLYGDNASANGCSQIN